MTQIKAIDNQSRHNSKAQIEAREKAEAKYVTNGTKPVMSEDVKSVPAMKKVFNKMVKSHPHWTEDDSIPLNDLVYYLHLQIDHKKRLLNVDETDGFEDDFERIQLRLEKIDKKIDTALKRLLMPLDSRMTLAHNMAKIALEEKKIEQAMNQNQPKEINPVLELLQRNTGVPQNEK